MSLVHTLGSIAAECGSRDTCLTAAWVPYVATDGSVGEVFYVCSRGLGHSADLHMAATDSEILAVWTVEPSPVECAEHQWVQPIAGVMFQACRACSTVKVVR